MPIGSSIGGIMANFSFKIDKDTLKMMEQLSKSRGKSKSEILRDWVNLGRAIDENSGKKSKLILKNPVDGREDFRIPINHLATIQ